MTQRASGGGKQQKKKKTHDISQRPLTRVHGVDMGCRVRGRCTVVPVSADHRRRTRLPAICHEPIVMVFGIACGYNTRVNNAR